jgi:hypothetical protein
MKFKTPTHNWPLSATGNRHSLIEHDLESLPRASTAWRCSIYYKTSFTDSHYLGGFRNATLTHITMVRVTEKFHNLLECEPF